MYAYIYIYIYIYIIGRILHVDLSCPTPKTPKPKFEQKITTNK